MPCLFKRTRNRQENRSDTWREGRWGGRIITRLSWSGLDIPSKPAQNARKWFATVEVERMSGDPDWLDKAIRIVEKQIHAINQKQRCKGQAEMLIIQ
jgi:hypothetical protein